MLLSFVEKSLMLHRIENNKNKEQDIHSFKIWQGEESLEFDIIGTPMIGDTWLTIKTLSKEIHFNVSHIDRFEFT